MLGLNLSLNFPFSPASEVTVPCRTPEEEVDAVTGKMVMTVRGFLTEFGKFNRLILHILFIFTIFLNSFE